MHQLVLIVVKGFETAVEEHLCRLGQLGPLNITG
jgi:hypothetical protein